MGMKTPKLVKNLQVCHAGSILCQRQRSAVGQVPGVLRGPDAPFEGSQFLYGLSRVSYVT